MKCLIVFCGLVAAALAYGSGAPEGACGDMVPQHGKDPQNSPFPYNVKLSAASIKPGGKVYVTVSSKAGDSFKGFFIQARVGDEPIGKFDAADGVKLVSCGNGANSGATHANPEPKSQVVVAWQAPSGLTETVTFYVTVARDGGTYWVGQKSGTLTVRKA